ncbi:MAG: type II secretion system GspH family protein [Candidatus Hydrogenedentes bacterium]|nr:type II secretion system GspH family protein [Candidatus Hydrogenedentota bacterium]
MHRKYLKKWGLTLIEIMIAVAIFAFVMGTTAITVVSVHNNLQIQRERIQAYHVCRSIIEVIREKRTDFITGDESFNWTGFYSWLNSQTNQDWLSLVSVQEHPINLQNLQINIDCRDMQNEPAGGSDNPIQVFVTASWQTSRGYQLQATLGSILTTR